MFQPDRIVEPKAKEQKKLAPKLDWQDLELLPLKQLRAVVATKLNKKYQASEDNRQFVTRVVNLINRRIIELNRNDIAALLEADSAGQGHDIFCFSKRQFQKYHGQSIVVYQYKGRKHLTAFPNCYYQKLAPECKQRTHRQCICRRARQTIRCLKLPTLLTVFSRSELLFAIERLLALETR